MNLDTSSIPPSILTPGIYPELNLYTGSAGLPVDTKKLMLVAQKLAAGTLAQATPRQVYTEAEVASLAGAGSISHLMAIQALSVSRNIPLYITCMDDAAASAAATATETLSGTATGAGTLTLMVGAKRVDVGILSGDDPTTLATRARAAMNAVPVLPVTVAGTVGALLCTSKNKGTAGNQLVLRAACTAPGITLSAAKVAFAGGATDPVWQTALDSIFPSQFHIIALQTTAQADIAKLKTHMDSVSSAVEMREGRGFAPASPTDTVAGVVAVATAINHERVHLVYERGSYSTGYEQVATVAAEVALESHPARPFNGLALPGIVIPDVPDRFIGSEREALLAAGVTPLGVDNQDSVIVRLVTTRTVINGVGDLSLLDTGTIASMDYFRFVWRARMKLKFPRPLLTDELLLSIEEQTIDVMKLLEVAQVLQHVDQYKGLVKAARDSNYPGRARIQVPSPVVPGLHQLFARFDLITP